jgi:Uma2 family endonuclease
MEMLTEISAYELERGKPMPSKLHSLTQKNLIVKPDVNYGKLYETFPELRLSLEDWDSVPDICLYKKKENDFSEDETEVTETPLCAVEILSPTQSLNDLIVKAGKYFEKGVLSCWLAIPVLKNIYVFESREVYEMYRFNEILIDKKLNISIPLAEVFK